MPRLALRLALCLSGCLLLGAQARWAAASASSAREFRLRLPGVHEWTWPEASADALLSLTQPWGWVLALSVALLVGLGCARLLGGLARGRARALGAAAGLASFLALQPHTLAFVLARRAGSATAYLDVEDLLRGLGAALFLLGVLGGRARREARPSSQRGQRALLACACLLPIVVGELLAEGVLDGGELTNDQRAYRFQAELFAEGELAHEAGELADFYPARQVLHDERGALYSKYPPGHSWTLALSQRLGLGWRLPRLLAGLCVLLTYAIARRLGASRPTDAALVFALSPSFLGIEAIGLAHGTSLPACLAFVWAALRALDDEQRALRWSCLAGACLSLALAARPLTALAVGLPFACALLRVGPALAARVVAGVALGAAPACAAFLWINAASTGSAWRTAYQLYAAQVSPDDTWGLANLASAPGNALYNTARLSVWLHGSSLSLVLCALGWCAARPRRALLTTSVPLALLALYSLHAFHGVPWAGPPYLVEGLACLALLSGQGLGRVREQHGERAASWLLLGLALSSCALLAPHMRLARTRVLERSAPQRAAVEAGLEQGVVFVAMQTPLDQKRFALLPTPGARLHFARDLGPRNIELMRALGQERAWRYEPATGQLEPLQGP